MSGVSRKLDRLEVVFDEESLVADAGLLVAATLMGRSGVEAVVDASVRPGAPTPGRKVQLSGHGRRPQHGVAARQGTCRTSADRDG